MVLRKFSLLSFPGDRSGPDIRITGSIGRNEGLMSVGCTLLGKLSELVFPPSEGHPGRKHRLWEETCVEFFLGVKGSERYREFNLSPAGHWNVYRFDRYREGMREEPAFTSLPFTVRIRPDALELSMELDVGKIIPAWETIEAGIAAVVKTVKGGTNYWALTHPGPRPDFHRRENFALIFPPAAHRPVIV